jgi:hypothetical protein
MIGNDILKSGLDGVFLFCGFRLDKEERDSVNEKDDLESYRFIITYKPVFICDVEEIRFRIIGVDKTDILFLFLVGDIDGLLPFEVFPHNEIAFESGRNSGDSPNHFLSKFIREEWIKNPLLGDAGFFQDREGVILAQL